MLHTAITRLAQVCALLGGVVLLGLTLLICASIIGREAVSLAGTGGLRDLLRQFGIGPVQGDYELVEAGMAFAVFSFLPLTQLTQSHARVDIFTSGLGSKLNAALATFWSVVMAAMILLISWRLFAGMQDRMLYNETSFLIQFPIWWAYAACFAAAIVACVVSLYCAAMRLTGRRIG